MRELILKMSMSIDGFVGDSDGGLRWVFDRDPEATAWTLKIVWNASLHIMGSRTFHDMTNFWPTSTEVFAPLMSKVLKAVFSKRGEAICRRSARRWLSGTLRQCRRNPIGGATARR